MAASLRLVLTKVCIIYVFDSINSKTNYFLI